MVISQHGMPLQHRLRCVRACRVLNQKWDVCRRAVQNVSKPLHVLLGIVVPVPVALFSI